MQSIVSSSFIIVISLLSSSLTVPSNANLVVDLESSSSDSNLFIELPYGEAEVESQPNIDVKYFTLLQPTRSINVKSTYGPITVRKAIYPSYSEIWQSKQKKQNDSVDHTLINNPHTHLDETILTSELSAHLVTKEIRRNNPVLRVLFYAGHTSDYSQRARIDFVDSSLCAVVVIEHQGEKLFGSCNPTKNREGACLAEVTLPVSWWSHNGDSSSYIASQLHHKQHKATFAKVSYTVLHSDQCSDDAFLGMTSNSPKHHALPLTYLSEVALTPFLGSYEEVTNDNIVTILIPQEATYPNSKIYVPVKFTYNPEYPLAAFSVRVKVKNGVRILGAQLSHPKESKGWQISVELSSKQNEATVTAYMRDFDLQQDISQSAPDELIENPSQEVYCWLFEVDNEVEMNDSGRIAWQVLYINEISSNGKKDFDGESSKLTSRLDIQKDEVLDLLAITKSKQLLNIACLNGKQVSQALRVYMISHAGKVSDVTLQSSCHSADESVLKVSPSCSSIFLDGSEVRGSQNATIIIKYGTFTGSGSYIVWMPQLPLEIRPADIKLSQIKSWKTPHVKHKQMNAHHNHYRAQSSNYHATAFNDSPLNRSMEDNLGHTNMNAKSFDANNDHEIDEGIISIGNDIGCKVRYQQTKVDVLTRFYTIDHNSGRETYFLTKRISSKITHLIMPFLRVSDPRVLILRGNIIEGINLGRCEVQVISPITGHVMGSKEIRVTPDRESLTHLDVRIVSGLELQVKPVEGMTNVWFAKTILLDKLTSQYQEGLLDIQLHFSDGSILPLSQVTSSDYNLSIDTFDSAVAFAPIAGFYPRVIAINPGKGQLLHVSLSMSNQCQKKRTQPLAMTYVNVNVDFKTSPTLQNDAFNFRKNNGIMMNAVSRNQSGNHENLLYQDRSSNNKPNSQTKLSNSGKAWSNVYEPTVQAHNHNSFVHRNRAMEVGFYSMIAIFGVAVFILVISCTVFAVKYKHKTPPETITTTRIAPLSSAPRPVVANASDWVWLGKATLERNAVKTDCTQPLLTHKDFNGNPISMDSIESQENKGSNRISGISYPGSEISIRITSNPNPMEDMDEAEDDEGDDEDETILFQMPEENTLKHISYTINAPAVPPRANHSTSAPPIPARRTQYGKFKTYMKPPPVPPHRNRININELNNSLCSAATPPPVPPHQHPHTHHFVKESRKSHKVDHQPQSAAERLNVDLTNNNQSDLELNTDSDTLSYNQMMQYFQSLKESSA